MPKFIHTPEQPALLPDDGEGVSFEETGYSLAKQSVLAASLIDEASGGSLSWQGLDDLRHFHPSNTAQGRGIHRFNEKLREKLPNRDLDRGDSGVLPTGRSE